MSTSVTTQEVDIFAAAWRDINCKMIIRRVLVRIRSYFYVESCTLSNEQCSALLPYVQYNNVAVMHR